MVCRYDRVYLRGYCDSSSSYLLILPINIQTSKIYFVCTLFEQAWHGRQRQRATRAEKLRLMALKSDDQEAYMKLVKESKNERLTTLLEETNKLLANLGAAVQRQKDAKLPEGIDLLKDSESDLSELDAPRSEPLQDLLPDQDIDITESDNNDDSNDLLEGQRQYNSAIHSIQEKVTLISIYLVAVW